MKKKLKRLSQIFQITILFFSFPSIYSQETPLGSKIVGNGDASNYYIGHFAVGGSDGLDLHWYGGIRFGDWTSNNVMQITNGNVGIGTISPSAKLHVNSTDVAAFFKSTTNAVPVSIINDGTSVSTIGFKGSTSLNEYNVRVGADGNDFISYTNNVERMRINSNGKVGIGTAIPDEKLTVNGKIHAQEVRIDLSSPMTVPDYVFSNDYKLKSLQEVEAYIKQNSHLPEIPSAQEIEKNGLMLAEMNMNLLKKIEELTLYMIEMKKEIASQNEKIKSLENKSNN